MERRLQPDSRQRGQAGQGPITRTGVVGVVRVVAAVGVGADSFVKRMSEKVKK
jgi:hypothetical protein